jgi:outer membrane lipoprotein-sorting protein
MKTWLRAAIVSCVSIASCSIGLSFGVSAQESSVQKPQSEENLALPPELQPSISWSGPRILADGEDSPQVTVLSPDDSATISRVERYLNGLSSVHARFVQVSTNGSFAEGEVHIKRPGKMRFQYDDPHPALLIANGLTLLYYDRELKQATFLPLWETPLWFLIREKVELTKDIKIVDVVQKTGTLAMVLQNDENGDTGQITLTFSDKPLRLHKWEVIDGQGIVTQVSLFNAEYDIPIEKSLFEYDDLEIDTPGLDDNRGR